jgi:hydroxypyruvate reductase
VSSPGASAPGARTGAGAADLRAELRRLYAAALAAVDGRAVVARALAAAPPPFAAGPLAVLAVGKAAAAMAEAAHGALGARVTHADLTAAHGHGHADLPWPCHEAGHPLPDAASERRAARVLALVQALPPGLPLLVLLSGGASALWAAPAAGLALADKRAATEALLRSGADIATINAVRRHLSRIKGGGLARAAGPRPLWTLALSDVAGDAPEAIGSGPTAPDPTRFADALASAERAGAAAALPPAALECLRAGVRGERPETAKPGEPCFAWARFQVVASLAQALEAAEASARVAGLRVRSLGPCLYGEARELAPALAAAARAARAEGIDLVLAGGEPTVRVQGTGRGGRAQELALAFALAVAGEADLCALFAGTDGRDGPTPAAGAFADGGLPARAVAARHDPAAALVANDSHPLLAATGDLFITGPTRTNVNDLALIRCGPRTFPGLAASSPRVTVAG